MHFIFLNKNTRISIMFSLKFFPKGTIDYIIALVQIMAWRRPGDKPLSEPMMVNWHIYASLCLSELMFRELLITSENDLHMHLL